MDNIYQSPYAPNFWKEHVWILYPTQYIKNCSNILNHSNHNVKELQDNTNSIELDRSTKSFNHSVKYEQYCNHSIQIHWNLVQNIGYKLDIVHIANNGWISQINQINQEINHKMSLLVPHSVPHGKNTRRSNTNILKFMQDIVPTFLIFFQNFENPMGQTNLKYYKTVLSV